MSIENKKFISHLSNKEYNIRYKKDKKAFKDELKKANITLEQYCDKFLKNIAQTQHLRELQKDEHYVYKNIRLSLGTYEKIIVNEKYHCELCKNFYAVRIQSFITHLKKHHKFGLYEYFKKIGYTEINPKYELCSFCGKHEARYDITWDINKRTFEKIYDGYLCYTPDCVNALCMKFFNEPYKTAKEKFEHIGGQTEFLCLRYKTTVEGLKHICKSKAAKNPSRWKSNLNGFIEKYGVEEGTRKYKERCKHISESQKLEWYVNKFGEDEGKRRYFDKMSKVSEFHKNNKKITSKGEYELFKLIKLVYNDAKLEYPTGDGIIDIYVPSKKAIIEYYGDYWHCNPSLYADDYYNRNLEMTAKEKHEFDKNKNEKYLKNIEHSKIAIIWESSFKLKKDNKEFLKPIILFIEKKSTENSILWV